MLLIWDSKNKSSAVDLPLPMTSVHAGGPSNSSLWSTLDAVTAVTGQQGPGRASTQILLAGSIFSAENL